MFSEQLFTIGDDSSEARKELKRAILKHEGKVVKNSPAVYKKYEQTLHLRPNSFPVEALADEMQPGSVISVDYIKACVIAGKALPHKGYRLHYTESGIEDEAESKEKEKEKEAEGEGEAAAEQAEGEGEGPGASSLGLSTQAAGDSSSSESGNISGSESSSGSEKNSEGATAAASKKSKKKESKKPAAKKPAAKKPAAKKAATAPAAPASAPSPAPAPAPAPAPVPAAVAAPAPVAAKAKTKANTKKKKENGVANGTQRKEEEAATEKEADDDDDDDDEEADGMSTPKTATTKGKGKEKAAAAASASAAGSAASGKSKGGRAGKRAKWSAEEIEIWGNFIGERFTKNNSIQGKTSLAFWEPLVASGKLPGRTAQAMREQYKRKPLMDAVNLENVLNMRPGSVASSRSRSRSQGSGRGRGRKRKRRSKKHHRGDSGSDSDSSSSSSSSSSSGSGSSSEEDDATTSVYHDQSANNVRLAAQSLVKETRLSVKDVFWALFQTNCNFLEARSLLLGERPLFDAWSAEEDKCLASFALGVARVGEKQRRKKARTLVAHVDAVVKKSDLGKPTKSALKEVLHSILEERTLDAVMVRARFLNEDAFV